MTKWMESTKEGIVVADGQNEGNSLRQLSYLRSLKSRCRSIEYCLCD